MPTLPDVPLPHFPVPTTGATEWKVRVATGVTFLAALAGSILLSTTATDYVELLPDWAENIIYPSLIALTTFLSGRAASSRPDYLSPSTVEAVEAWLRQNAPRLPRQ
jgi:hypothetical protein